MQGLQPTLRPDRKMSSSWHRLFHPLTKLPSCPYAKGTCRAGDVRVHLEYRDLPSTVSVAAELGAKGFLVPHYFPNKLTRFLARPGLFSLDGFVQAEAKDASPFWMRILACTLACVGFWTGGDGQNTSAGLEKKLVLTLRGLAVCFSVCAVLWAYWYGVEDAAAPFLGAAAIFCGPVFFGSPARGSVTRKGKQL